MLIAECLLTGICEGVLIKPTLTSVIGEKATLSNPLDEVILDPLPLLLILLVLLRRKEVFSSLPPL